MRLTDLPGCEADAPAFTEPWQAQAFALVLAMHDRKLFSWTEWAQTLGTVIAQAREAGEPDTADSYYRQWLRALERLVSDKGLAPPLALGALRQAWRTAAEVTPHGQPVTLPAGVLAMALPRR